MIASLRYERNSIGVEIDPEYCRLAAAYLKTECSDMFHDAHPVFEEACFGEATSVIKEAPGLYGARPARRRLE